MISITHTSAAFLSSNEKTMKISASVFVSVFFACFWFKVDADCTFTHLGWRSEKLIRTGDKVTDDDMCREWECLNNGGWAWRDCTVWSVGDKKFEREPNDLSKPYPDCCGKLVFKTFYDDLTTEVPFTQKAFKDKVAREEYYFQRNLYPDASSGVVLSVIPSLVISSIFLITTQFNLY